MPPGCQCIADMLSDFLDDELDAREQWEVVLHLEGCSRMRPVRGRAGRHRERPARPPEGRPQSWQPETSRDDLAQHCADFSGAQQAFFFVSIFMVCS